MDKTVKILNISDRRIPSASIGLQSQQLVGGKGKEEEGKVFYYYRLILFYQTKFSFLLEKSKSWETQIPRWHLIAHAFC